ncbi:hypothetical protein [Ornithinibacillus contaminans]|uniref:hypothetical protein n=1 Tax=Ornithinibacillus contaminans TaxID=694055 RepID=UPI00064E0311|nr:hypothetical protein [Ornithinibacillus contaminans]
MNTQVENKNLTQEEAVALANEITRLDSAVKQMKNQLKEYVDEHGSVEAGGNIWGYSESVSWKLESKKMKDLMAMITIEGFNPLEMLSISKSNLDKLGWSDDVLKQYGEKKVSSRFGSKKA